MRLDVAFRDMQPIDLDDLVWAGGLAHARAMEAALERSWRGEVEAVVAEVGGLRLIAHGFVDYAAHDGVGFITMLAVHEAWQGLGIGKAMIGELERRIAAAGLPRAALYVEKDHPAAQGLYAGLGYEVVGSAVDHWPLDDGTRHAAPVFVMERELGASSASRES